MVNRLNSNVAPVLVAVDDRKSTLPLCIGWLQLDVVILDTYALHLFTEVQAMLLNDAYVYTILP
jgi:hypothetical protein